MQEPAQRERISIFHPATERVVPIEVPTVFGRSDHYYRYRPEDERGDRLEEAVADGLSQLNYVQLSSDPGVSRTHGLLDPGVPGIRDLHSTNGIYVNERRLPSRKGTGGDVHRLVPGDVLRIGGQRFEVRVARMTEEELTLAVRAQRLACVAYVPEQRPRAEAFAEFLRERLGFRVRCAVGLQECISNAYRLQEAEVDDGIVLYGLFVGCRGSELRFGEDSIPFARLVPLFSEMPGRKLVVLETDLDPTGCEQTFSHMAYEDMVLISCAGAGPGALGQGSEEAPVGTDMVSKTLGRLRASIHSGDGVYDAPEDALAQFVSADSNVLRVGWIRGYSGRLKLTFGERLRGFEEAVSHSLQLGSSTFRF